MNSKDQARLSLLKEGYRLTERQLDAQLVLSSSSVQRGLIFAGVGVASSAFSLDFLIEGVNSEVSLYDLSPILYLLSALLAAISTLPGKFLTGSKFRFVEDKIDQLESETQYLLSLAKNNDLYIELNNRKQSFSSRFFYIGMYLFIAGTTINGLYLFSEVYGVEFFSVPSEWFDVLFGNDANCDQKSNDQCYHQE